MEARGTLAGLVACALALGCVETPLAPRTAGQTSASTEVVAAGCSEDPANQAAYEALRRRAESGERVRVIAQLRVSGPADPESAAYLSAIRQAQEAVIAELPRATFTVTRRLETVPLLGLEVSLQGLERLARSRYVNCVSDDGLSAPI